jgi:thioredoxin 1
MSRVKVLFFSSPTCGPCKVVKPTIEELQEDYDGHFEWTHVDTLNDRGNFATQLRVRLVPTLVVVKPDGSEFGRHEGTSLIGYFNLLRRAKALLLT